MESNFKYETLAPGIEIHHPIIDPQKILDSVKDSNRWYESMIGGNYQGIVDKSYRDCMIHNLPYDLQGDVIWYQMAQAFAAHAGDYCLRNHTDYRYIESPQLLHYTAGEGFYQMHSDYMPGNPRVFSAVYYLNDVEIGGETVFPRFDVTIKPVANTLALFPANYIYEHEARAPISNDKYAVVTWFNL